MNLTKQFRKILKTSQGLAGRSGLQDACILGVLLEPGFPKHQSKCRSVRPSQACHQCSAVYLIGIFVGPARPSVKTALGSFHELVTSPCANLIQQHEQIAVFFPCTGSLAPKPISNCLYIYKYGPMPMYEPKVHRSLDCQASRPSSWQQSLSCRHTVGPLFDVWVCLQTKQNI